MSYLFYDILEKYNFIPNLQMSLIPQTCKNAYISVTI